MGEVRFYHLTELPLERVLPTMLERTLARDQRAVVRGGVAERLAYLDTHLWTYGDGTFLPHGTAQEPHVERQPILLTEGSEIPNGAAALFLIDGAGFQADEIAEMEVTTVLFDGHDPAAVDNARGQWRAVTAAGHPAVYWAQAAGGQWEKKHESAGKPAGD